MKIIIVGLGQTGRLLLSSLAGENIDIVVIDQDQKLVDEATDRFSVNGIVGSAASRETLLAAGADTADIILALTRTDEVNLLSCMQAKALGTRFSAARIVMSDLVNEAKSLRREYSIDLIMKPRHDIAEEIYRNIGMPGFAKLEGFWGEKIQLMDMNILEDSVLRDRSLTEIRQTLKLDILVITVLRNGRLYVPTGSFVIKKGDSLNIAVSGKKLNETLEQLGIKKSRAKRIVIIGGSNICDHLLEMLKEDKCDITILERDRAKCRRLMEKYPHINVEYADEDTLEILEQENLTSADVVISLTEFDETNLITSMYAWSRGIPSIITRVDKPEHVKLLYNVNIDITVSPAASTARKALRFLKNAEAVEAGGKIGKYYLLADSKAEIMEIPATDDFRCLGIELKDRAFKLKKDVLITAVIRGGELIIPSGTTCIKPGDRVIVTSSRKNGIRSLNDILC